MVLSWLVKPEDNSPLEAMSMLRCGSKGINGRCPVPYLQTHITGAERFIYFIKDCSRSINKWKLLYKEGKSSETLPVSIWYPDGSRRKHFFPETCEIFNQQSHNGGSATQTKHSFCGICCLYLSGCRSEGTAAFSLWLRADALGFQSIKAVSHHS